MGPLYVARYSYLSGMGGMLADLSESSRSSVITLCYGVGVTFHVLGKKEDYIIQCLSG